MNINMEIKLKCSSCNTNIKKIFYKITHGMLCSSWVFALAYFPYKLRLLCCHHLLSEDHFKNISTPTLRYRLLLTSSHIFIHQRLEPKRANAKVNLIYSTNNSQTKNHDINKWSKLRHKTPYFLDQFLFVSSSLF